MPPPDSFKRRLASRFCGWARLLLVANPRPRKGTTQHGADVTHIQAAGSEREDAPENREHTERVSPKQVAHHEEGRAGDHAKDAACRAVDEMGERRLIESFVPAQTRYLLLGRRRGTFVLHLAQCEPRYQPLADINECMQCNGRPQ